MVVMKTKDICLELRYYDVQQTPNCCYGISPIDSQGNKIWADTISEDGADIAWEDESGRTSDTGQETLDEIPVDSVNVDDMLNEAKTMFNIPQDDLEELKLIVDLVKNRLSNKKLREITMKLWNIRNNQVEPFIRNIPKVPFVEFADSTIGRLWYLSVEAGSNRMYFDTRSPDINGPRVLKFGAANMVEAKRDKLVVGTNSVAMLED